MLAETSVRRSVLPGTSVNIWWTSFQSFFSALTDTYVGLCLFFYFVVVVYNNRIMVYVVFCFLVPKVSLKIIRCPRDM